MATPIANYSYTKLGLEVTFTDHSTESPISHEWDFGDGTGSTDVNPIHTYNAPGIYEVILVVENNDGTDTYTTEIEVMVLADPPVAYFAYIKYGLEVKFINLTVGDEVEPTEYSWDFGDTGTSIEENPIHIYGTPGIYVVTLEATNGGGTGDPVVITLEVGENIEININLPTLIDDYMPADLLGSASMVRKITLINKWQLYLQPLVYFENPDTELPYYEVEVVDTHNETAWPVLVNYLIAQLAAYDIILQGANQFLANVGNLAGEKTGESITTGNIKSIETGPAKTEWYDDMSAEQLDKLSKVYANAVKPGGILDQIKESICQLAARVRIYLPMCGQLAHNTIVPQVTNRIGNNRHNANPFGITKRML